MRVEDSSSLKCSNQHSFDFSKQGYLNFIDHAVNTHYSKELFEARNKLMNEGSFFTPLIDHIAEMIIQQKKTLPKITILDAGCGEGSHLAQISEYIAVNAENEPVGIGIDLSKEGIKFAAQKYTNHIWAVADLANTPFQTNEIDVLLNILSPSNYEEFKRIMKEDGIMIKVVPQEHYLSELREYFYADAERETYSNQETVDLFFKNFEQAEQKRVTYTVQIPQHLLSALVQMTPLSWSASEEKINAFNTQKAVKVTVDLDILIGQMKAQ